MPHRARDTRLVIQISNSQASTFSRRKASEVCQSLAKPREGMERWEAPGHQWDTLEAGGEPTSRGKATARAQGKAQRLPALHQTTRPSTGPGRPGPASSRSVRLKDRF